MQSEKLSVFGGYSKIGFKSNKQNVEIDNNCFLFSIDRQKIFPVIKERPIIINNNNIGLCFSNSLFFFDNFMNKSYKNINPFLTSNFSNILAINDINYYGESEFKYNEIEVYQII